MTPHPQIRPFPALALAVLLLPGSLPGQTTAGKAFTSELLPARAPLAEGQPLFTALSPKETGVNFVNALVEGHPLEHLYASEKAVGGVAVGDVDGDGRPDLYFTNGPGENRLYRQTANLKFEDITEKAGVSSGTAWSAGAAMADIDNDGDLDIYVANYDSSNHLFINDGNGVFKEEARRFALHAVSASHMPAFCDYDRDGDLDVFLLTNRFHSKTGQPPFNQAVEMKVVPNKGLEVNFRDPKWARYFTIKHTGNLPDGRPQFNLLKVAQTDRLLRNDGKDARTGRWKFTNVSKQAGLAGSGFGLSATWWDYNQDGWPDLWVANDFDDPDRVYRNNGDGTFTDVVKQIGPHITWFSMGADFGDLNGDALPDFLIADMSGTNHFKQKTAMGAMGAKAEFLATANPQQYMRNALFLNSGTERFLEGAFLAGLANSDWTWTVKLADFDNDGRSDVYLTNGMTRNFNDSDGEGAVSKLNENEWDRHKRAGTPELREQNLAYRNQGNLDFEDVSKKWGLDMVGMSFAAAHADLDGDGDLDLVVSNAEAPATIYRNNESTGNRLTIRLQGTVSNKRGLGAQLRLVTKSGVQIRELTPVRGYLSSNQSLVHFGLGSDEEIEELRVDWPSGHRQTFPKLAVNKRLTITEPANKATIRPRPRPKSDPPFQPSKELARAYHADNEYDDYQRQPLLPHKLSRLGAGQAWGDLDGDGDQDFWIGSGYGRGGQLWVNQGKGQFVQLPSPALENDKSKEDMGALWFDADGDDDLDLYVCSGGYEFPARSNVLQDRLYLNDGKGGLTKASREALPVRKEASSMVVAADFDRDGDLDLFVGGRLVPGDFPAPAQSTLLRNEGGKFTDQTEALLPSLKAGGLVTSALWSDANGDGWIDLLLTNDWGSVQLFLNEKGAAFHDATEESGMAALTGWWNGIASADFDGDGDLDYVVTNVGLNTKYHADEKHPTSIYYGDFEESGRKRIIESEFEGDTEYPIRGRSCSTNAMPHLGKKYDSFEGFALESLPAIYTPQCLDEALKLSATTLASGVFRNDSSGDKMKFSFLPLPKLAQIAPGFGVVATEVNGDGHPDLILAQNFYSPQPETGRMAGGLGLLLLGKGDATFRTQAAHESGIFIPGDARSLATSDLDGDGTLDLTVGLNHSIVQTFTHRRASAGKVLSVSFPPHSGARLTCTLSNGSTQTAEWQAGGSYLSQRAPAVTFGIPKGSRVTALKVRWPDGKTSTHAVPTGKTSVHVSPK